MSPGIGEAFVEIEELRRTAQAGGTWYLGERDGDSVDLIVMVDTGELTAFDCTFMLDSSGAFATYTLDISDREAIGPASSSPSYGWIGWLNGDIAIASQNTDTETQGTAEWPSRSPFSESLDELEDDAVFDGLARIVAAIVLHDFGQDEDALRYLPETAADDHDG